MATYHLCHLCLLATVVVVPAEDGVANAIRGIGQACTDHSLSASGGKCLEDGSEVSLLQSQLSVDQGDLTNHNGVTSGQKPVKLGSALLEDASFSWIDRGAAHVAAHGVTSGIIVGIVVFLLVFIALVAPSRWHADPSKTLAEEGERSTSASAVANNGASMKMVLFLVLGHSASGSTLTVVNKWAMNSFHPPYAAASDHQHSYVWTLCLLQFIASAVVAKLVGLFGFAKCDPLEWKRAVSFFPAAGMFMISVVAGNMVMMFSNVSSFLVLRALCPLPVAFAEIFIYKDPMPPALSWAALCLVICGAVQYASCLGGIQFGATAWALIFLITMPIDALLVKHAISSANLSAWGSVYYNNILAAVPLFAYVVWFELPNTEAFIAMTNALLSEEARVAVAASCLVGIALSFFQMTTRYYISATAFMMLGIVNKFLTVLWNEVFIGRDSAFALLGVLLTLVGAVVWQLSMGSNSVQVREKSEASWSTAVTASVVTTLVLIAAGFIQQFFVTHAK